MNLQKFVWLWNKSKGLSTPKLHSRIVDWLYNQNSADVRHLLLLVFRGAGKSSLTALYAAWHLHRNPNIRILIISAEASLAQKMSWHVGSIMESHPAFGGMKTLGKQWAKGQFTISRSAILRDPSVIAKGLESNFTGCRADLILCDDVEVPATSSSMSKRQKLIERLSDLEFVLAPNGQIMFIGTPHSHDSIYRLDPKSDYEISSGFLKNYNRLTIPVLDDIGRSAWEDRFSPKLLATLCHQIGSRAFNSQMLLKPMTTSRSRLDRSLIRFINVGDFEKSFDSKSTISVLGRKINHTICFWDVAFGMKKRGDASAIALLHSDFDKNIYVEDVEFIQNREDVSDIGPLNYSTNIVSDFISKHDVKKIFVESNGIGQFVPDALRKSLSSRMTHCSVIPHHTKTNKSMRILENIEPLLESNRLFIRKGLNSERLIEEFENWQPDSSGHDDGLDATASAISLIPGIFNFSTPNKPSAANVNFDVW